MTSTQIFVTAVSEDIIKFVVLTFIIKTEHMRKEDQLMEAYDAPNIEVIEVEVEQVILSSSIDDMGYGDNNW